MPEDTHSRDSTLPSPSEPSDKVCPVCGAAYVFDMLVCPDDGSRLRPNVVQDELTGCVVADRYRIIRKLGEGAMGRVYLAEQISMSRMCALKIMPSALRGDPEVVARFRRAAADAGRISHPNVAALYDSGESADHLYLAMEYVPGDSLRRLLRRERALSPPRAAGIALQASSALEAAHRLGILHRDLKPDNIILSPSDDGDDLVKVVDFGIVMAAWEASSPETITRAGLGVGTILYMSPEQMIGSGTDARGDLYSLGAILYEMLVGKRIFEDDTGDITVSSRLDQMPRRPREFNPGIPRELDELVMKLLAIQAADRFQSARELRLALAPLPLDSVAASPRSPALTQHRATVPVQDLADGTAGASPTSASPAATTPGAPPRAGVTPGVVTSGAPASAASAPALGAPPGAGGIMAAEAAPSRGGPASEPLDPSSVSAGGGAPAVATTLTTERDRFAPRFRPSAAGSAGRRRWTWAAPALLGLVALSTVAVSVWPGGGSDIPMVDPPRVYMLVPGELVAGADGDSEVMVYGSEFIPESAVHWNGTRLPTTFIDAHTLRAVVPSAGVASPGEARVTVENPGPSVSLPLVYRVDDARDVLASETVESRNDGAGRRETLATTAGGGATSQTQPAPPGPSQPDPRLQAPPTPSEIPDFSILNVPILEIDPLSIPSLPGSGYDTPGAPGARRSSGQGSSVTPTLLNAAQIGREVTLNYPSNLRATGHGGTATLRISLDATGAVDGVQIASSSGQPALDDVAVRIILRTARFAPATLDGKPVPIVVEMPVSFVPGG